MKTCPMCNGEGELKAALEPISFACPLCQTRGIITEAKFRRFEIGIKCKELRRNAGFTLRSFAELNKVMPSTISEMEWGIRKINKKFYEKR